MTDHEGDIRGYHWLSKSWYAEPNLRIADYVDEINLGFFSPDGGTSGEFSVKWYKLGNISKPCPRI